MAFFKDAGSRVSVLSAHKYFELNFSKEGRPFIGGSLGIFVKSRSRYNLDGFWNTRPLARQTALRIS
jgi:hypothetical protein